MWNSRPVERAYAQELSLRIRQKAFEKKQREKAQQQGQGAYAQADVITSLDRQQPEATAPVG